MSSFVVGRVRSRLLGLSFILVSACSSPSPSPTRRDGGIDGRGEGVVHRDLGPRDLHPSDADASEVADLFTRDAPGDLPAAAGPCTAGARRCAGTGTEALCQKGAGGLAWITTACPHDQVCIKDRCVPACVDTCYYGEERVVGGVKERCKRYDAKTHSFGALGGGTHDRMRSYLAWIRRHHLPNGYIADTLFTDATFAKKEAYLGTVDAGEWTGIYLVAESLRLMATRSPDAERAVQAEAERICQLFDITSTKIPQPGYMARFWAPLGENPLWDAIYNPADPTHRKTTYRGKTAFYLGDTSRDMYHGAILGLGLAYDALQTPKDKKRIRQTILTLVGELVREHKKVPVKVVWGTNAIPLPITVDLQHVILVPDEMEKGSILVRIGTKSDANDWEHSELHGLREFFPDFAPVIRQILNQIPIIGPPAAKLVPPITRSSATSLAFFIRLALHIIDDVPPTDPDYAALQKQRALIYKHYMALKPSLLPIIRSWSYLNAQACWKSYFGITIAYHPAFGLSRIETDKDYKAAIQERFQKSLWPLIKTHKNLYFTYITAGETPPGFVTSSEIAAAKVQLDQIRPPPKNRRLIDNTSAYPADAKCQAGVEGAPMTTVAVDLKDRIPVDSLWQHHPFRLKTWQPLDRYVLNSTDYIVAYWLARAYGFTSDDVPNTCLRWTTK